MQTKYKKDLKSLLLTLLVVFLGVGSFLTSCDDDDEGGTNEVVLLSYGPMPIARGGELRFIGENLSGVNSIIIPPGLEITSADFTEHSNKSIKLTVPQDAVEGYVELLAGEVTIVTKTKIGYSEPISIGAFSPETIKPGTLLTLDGDYLNLVGEVIFTDRIVVDSTMFTTQSRKQITLNVPMTAQTGKIAVSNGAEDPIIVYSTEDLTVAVPMLESLAPEQIKAGAEITISGQDLDLVASINFQGGSSVEADDFKSQSSSTLIVAAPDNIQDGVVTLITHSGIEIPSTQSLTTIVPTNVVIEAASRFKSGLDVLISGTDLDLVTSVLFTGGSATTEFSLADNTLTVQLPEDATDGVVTLNMASEKSVETDAIVLVKPTVTQIAPNPVTAGGSIVVTGTDLDLIKSATFGGDVMADVIPGSESSISFAVPVTATTGIVALNLANGTAVNTSSLTVINPVFCFIPVLPDAETKIFPGTLFLFEVENGAMLTEVRIGGNSTQFIVDGNTLHTLIPKDAAGVTDLTLISSNGEITYSINVTTLETVIFEGPISITWSDGGRAMVPSAAFDGIAAGTVMKIYFTQTENWGQAQINHGGWGTIAFEELGNDGYLKTDMYVKSDTVQELVLTEAVLNAIRSNAADGNGIIIQGQDWIIDKISIVN